MWVTAVFCLVLYSLALCFLFSSNSPTQRVIVVEDIVIPSGSYNVVDNKAGYNDTDAGSGYIVINHGEDEHVFDPDGSVPTPATVLPPEVHGLRAVRAAGGGEHPGDFDWGAVFE